MFASTINACGIATRRGVDQRCQARCSAAAVGLAFNGGKLADCRCEQNGIEQDAVFLVQSQLDRRVAAAVDDVTQRADQFRPAGLLGGVELLHQVGQLGAVTQGADTAWIKDA